MQRRPDVLLELALLALRRVCEFLGERSLPTYLGDALGQLRKTAPEIFARIPDGDLIVAFRNVLAHGYAALDHTRVYQTAAVEAPALLKTLEQLLAEFPE